MKDQPLPLGASATRHTTQKSLRTNPIKRTMLCKAYDVDPTRVLVTWQEYLPADNEVLPDKAILFFPGWPLRAESESIRRLAEELANSSNARTYVLHTRSEHIIPASLYQEARAVCKFLAEMHLTHLTLVGYSQGSIKAIDTIILLQATNPGICIEGLVLIVPVGLVDIDSRELVRRYIVDSLITSFIVVLREVVSKSSFRMKWIALAKNGVLAFRALLAFFHGVLKEMRASQWNYLARFKNDVGEMSQMSPYLREIRVPVVIVQGARDRVSDRNRILAQVSTQLNRGQLYDPVEDWPALGEQRLAENLFSQSPNVTMVKAQKLGSHLLPLLRPRSIARVSLYLLQRCQRRGWTKPPEPVCEEHQHIMLLPQPASYSADDKPSELAKERL